MEKKRPVSRVIFCLHKCNEILSHVSHKLIVLIRLISSDSLIYLFCYEPDQLRSSFPNCVDMHKTTSADSKLHYASFFSESCQAEILTEDLLTVNDDEVRQGLQGLVQTGKAQGFKTCALS